MRWSRPDILNAVRELSRFMQRANPAHVKAMYHVMTYCVATPERGLLIKPNRKWNGDPNFEFEILGMSGANYATDPTTRKSISGFLVFLEGAPISMKSGQQNVVTLSSAEAELYAATQCAQDMLYAMRVLESMRLKVKKPMILQVDNKGAVDLANNWSIGGRTRHVEVRQYFLRDLKREGTILVEWVSGEEMSSDIFTKNCPGPLYEKHVKCFCGLDMYGKKNGG
jgi:hypothetical protein